MVFSTEEVSKSCQALTNSATTELFRGEEEGQETMRMDTQSENQTKRP